MSRSLQERGPKQLAVSEADASAQEQRPRRFFATPGKDTPLTDFPLYEGEAAHGRARAPLSEREQQKRLKHIAQENLERAESTELLGSEVVDFMAWQDVRRRRKRAAFKEFEPAPRSWAIFKENNQERLRVPIGAWKVVFTSLSPPQSRTFSSRLGEWCAKAVLILKFLGYNR